MEKTVEGEPLERRETISNCLFVCLLTNTFISLYYFYYLHIFLAKTKHVENHNYFVMKAI